MSLPYKTENWERTAAFQRQLLHASIPQNHRLPPHLADKVSRDELLPLDESLLSCGILSPLNLEITGTNDAAVLVESIISYKYTAVQDDALERARWLDDYFRKEGKPAGILHGLPVSVKDVFNIKGIPTTCGLVFWIPNTPDENSAVADALLDAGAVLYVKTNVSQACLMVETVNNVFGTTKNPHNLELSVDGSSGGEAVLVAARGAIMASGTDGGSNIRFLSVFCGLYKGAVKCSKGRLPTRGLMTPADGNESTNTRIGPMARTVSSLELWLQAQLQVAPWDSDNGCIPMPWDWKQARRPIQRLTIGMIWDDHVVKPTPPVTRAVAEITATLRKAGHRLIDLTENEIKELHRLGTSSVMKSNVQSNGYLVMEHINASGEPVVPRTATGSSASFLTTPEIFANHAVRGEVAQRYNNLWTRLRLDAIISPAVAHPAPPHRTYVSNAYSSIYNMLDYVTGSAPVTKVDLDLDVASSEWYESEAYPRIEKTKSPYDWGDEEMKHLYKGPHVYKDSPVGIQVVCRGLREEKLRSSLKEVEGLTSSSNS